MRSPFGSVGDDFNLVRYFFFYDFFAIVTIPFIAFACVLRLVQQNLNSCPFYFRNILPEDLCF